MKDKISYSLKKLSEKEYKDAPEEVRKVYIHVTKKIPMDEKEKARILRSHPGYFTQKKAQTFAQRVGKMEAKKSLQHRSKRNTGRKPMKSYLKNCLTLLTEKDLANREIIFFDNDQGEVLARLDGYAIIPRVEYERLRALEKVAENKYELKA
ncbi:hypothetical protein [Cyclobacterium sp.]|uniref:hypothetical protein n=1 Tax=Cyclobacterium sp. TaxID=1966343 RepID=UPI0019C590A4|nr:hypothetical protein [Cyclobacterium sp.]MBD3627628.1 hypothetical protein [Cyclobacterium sp.]